MIIKAFSDVPTNVLIRRFCFIALKNSSICHRSIINGGDCCCTKCHMIGQKFNVSVIAFIKYDDFS